MTDETTTAALAGVNATMPEALELNTLSVIGVMDAHDGMAALLRSARGEIVRVTVGDEAFGVQVTAIGEDQVLLTDRSGRTQSLALPRS
jgi:Tfp pilus assembly protein PilP